MKGGVNVVHIITNTITATTKNSEVGVTVAPFSIGSWNDVWK